jgi:hypothetical protein
MRSEPSRSARAQAAISAAGHALGLSVGLKGNNTEAMQLEPLFDWALSEQCWEYSECSNFQGFVSHDKAAALRA